MYLSARKYVSRYDYSGSYEGWPPPTADEFATLTYSAPDGLTKFGESGGIEVSYPIAYWRKANAIHGWFVNKCAGGVDECQPIYVSREKLVVLRDLCRQSVEQPAMAGDILPPTPGFFFGTYEVDEWYIQDMKYTIKMIDHILDIIPEDNWDWSFIYHASW
jgi:hypothetical protein